MALPRDAALAGEHAPQRAAEQHEGDAAQHRSGGDAVAGADAEQEALHRARERQREPEADAETDSEQPDSRIVARVAYTSSMITGARPRESSSVMSSFGSRTSTRASESIRCSPPESVPAA